VDPTGELILPDSPAGLPDGWYHDPSHRNPNGEMWRHPSGDQLEWHPGQEGAPGWRGRDHWHHNKGKDHLPPGIEVPDPIEPMEPCEFSFSSATSTKLDVPWWAFLFLIPVVGPQLAP